MMSHTRKTTTVSVGTEDQPLVVEVTQGLDSLVTRRILAKTFEWDHSSLRVKVTGYRINSKGDTGSAAWGYMPRDQVPGTVLAHLISADA